MVTVINHPCVYGMVRLNGEISDYSVKRDRASFVFTKSDQTKLGVVAIAASLVGMGGQAMSVASSTTSMEEEADYVQFSLNGHSVKGWLWRSPFKNGDMVDVAAEWQADHYEVFGIARPSDKTISLYPHCSRAKTRHIKNAVKWWLIVSIALELGISAIFLTNGWSGLVDFWQELFAEGGWWIPVGLTVFCAIAVACMAKQWMPFVKLSERVFSALALPNPHNIDLVKSSKGRRTEQDNLEFGYMYFRY
jgi:hypothetical protein